MVGCHLQHEFRHSSRDSRINTMARWVQQGLSAVRALILVRTEEVGWKVSHDGNKGFKVEGTIRLLADQAISR